VRLLHAARLELPSSALSRLVLLHGLSGRRSDFFITPSVRPSTAAPLCVIARFAIVDSGLERLVCCIAMVGGGLLPAQAGAAFLAALSPSVVCHFQSCTLPELLRPSLRVLRRTQPLRSLRKGATQLRCHFFEVFQNLTEILAQFQRMSEMGRYYYMFVHQVRPILHEGSVAENYGCHGQSSNKCFTISISCKSFLNLPFGISKTPN
jgi:hypothetical protein